MDSTLESQNSKVLIFAAPLTPKNFSLLEQDFDCVINLYHGCHIPTSSPELHFPSSISLMSEEISSLHNLKYIASKKLFALSQLFDHKIVSLFMVLDSRAVSILTYTFKGDITYLISFQPKTKDYNYEYIEYIYSLLSSWNFLLIFNRKIKTLKDVKIIISLNQPIILYAQSKSLPATDAVFFKRLIITVAKSL